MQLMSPFPSNFVCAPYISTLALSKSQIPYVKTEKLFWKLDRLLLSCFQKKKAKNNLLIQDLYHLLWLTFPVKSVNPFVVSDDTN